MKATIYRLALIQFLAVVYCVLGTAVVLKLRWGTRVGTGFATDLRDYGFLLLFLPAAWLLWASWFARRPEVGTGPSLLILISGLGLLGFLVVLAFMGTVLASSSLIQVSPSS